MEEEVKKTAGLWTPHPKKAKARCPHCNQWIKEVGMEDHLRDKHKVWTPQT
jgi:hypothetical protein